MTRVAVAVAMCALAAPAASGFRQSAATVSVFASFERDGRPGIRLAEPARDQVSVSIDGRPAHVVEVSRAARASVLLLVDLTWSTTRGHHPGLDAEVSHLKSAMNRIAQPWASFPGLIRGMDRAFLPLLAPQDGIRIGSFAGQRLSFARAASTDTAARLSAFKEVINTDVVPLADWFGASRIWDAVASASTQLSSDSPVRSIVLVTDGQASGNRIGHADAIAAAISHGVVVHVVCEKSWWDAILAPPAETFVGRLAEQTGGLLRIDDAFGEQRMAYAWDKPAPVFREIMEALHNTYEIRVNATGVAEGRHQLDVKARAPGMRAHAPAWVTIGAPQGAR